MQSLDALREQVQAQGNLRTAAPGNTFSLLDHAEHDGSNDARDRFVVLSAQHRARNNVSADHQAQVTSLLGAIANLGAINARADDGSEASPAKLAKLANETVNATDAPIYQVRLVAQRAAVPVRMVRMSARSDAMRLGGVGGVDSATLPDACLPDVRLHPRPTLHGVQTAVVVGISGQPIHTARDQR